MKKIDSKYNFPSLFKEMGKIKNGIELGVSYGNFSKYLLDNYAFIEIFKGNVNEIAFIKKK